MNALNLYNALCAHPNVNSPRKLLEDMEATWNICRSATIIPPGIDRSCLAAIMYRNPTIRQMLVDSPEEKTGFLNAINHAQGKAAMLLTVNSNDLRMLEELRETKVVGDVLF